MACHEPQLLRCRCGRDFVASVVGLVNAGRSPQMRAALLAGEFQRVRCPYCRQFSGVRRDFFYVDFTRRLLVFVAAGRRLRDDAAVAVLGAAARVIPAWLVPAGECECRVVRGPGALAQLLAAQDAAAVPAAVDRGVPAAAFVLAPPDAGLREILHEVGHAVHASARDRVDEWLAGRFGWRTYQANQVDEWVEALGGWGGMSSEELEPAREHLWRLLGGGGQWGPADVPELPDTHAWWRTDCPPRLAVQRAGVDHWYMRSADWHTHAGRAFFLNYRDAEFTAVAVSTVGLVQAMPTVRAAMSGPEFFAELYAFVVGRVAEARAVVPADVLRWFAGLGAAAV